MMSAEIEDFHESRPSPDPTKMTTAALGLAITSLKELEEAKIKALDDKVEQRRQDVNSAFDQIRKTAELLQGQITADNRTLLGRLDTMNGLISAITSRLDRGEGVGSGADKARAAGLSITGERLAIGGFCLGLLSLILAAAAALYNMLGRSTQPGITVSPPASISAPATK